MAEKADSPPRFTFSFGFKLALAMVVIVAVISLFTLLITQNRVSRLSDFVRILLE